MTVQFRLIAVWLAVVLSFGVGPITAQAEGLDSIEQNAYSAAINMIDGSQDPLPYDTEAWRLATQQATLAAYAQYEKGWIQGVSYVEMRIWTFNDAARRFQTTDSDIYGAAEQVKQNQALAIEWETNVLPIASHNAEVAANRFALIYADFSVVDGKIIVTPKASDMFVVSLVEGSEKTTVDGKLQVTIQVTDTTGQSNQVVFTQDANEFNTYIAAPTPTPSVSPTPTIPTTSNLTTVTGIKLKTGKKSLKVYWKKAPQAQNVACYQIQYNKKGVTASKSKFVSAKKASVTIKKLRKGKTYLVKVRSCNTIDGSRVYGPWSSTRTKKVKR